MLAGKLSDSAFSPALLARSRVLVSSGNSSTLIVLNIFVSGRCFP